MNVMLTSECIINMTLYTTYTENLHYLISFDIKSVDEFIVYNALERAVKERKTMYSVVSFNLQSVPSEKCQFIFRFDKQDIIRLYEVLRLPNRVETSDQHIIGLEGLCLLLRRFAYPSRLKLLEEEFAPHYTSLSKLLQEIIDIIYKKWGTLLLSLSENKWFSSSFQKELAAIVHAKGAPLTNCIGFIDETARAICRPSVNQKELYSGHKRQHCIKFQSITLPNGIMVHMSMPYSGRRHDAFILKDTLILDQLQLYCYPYCIYGDEGYPLKKQLLRPYSSTTLSEQQTVFNREMSKLRQCVEWSFGKLLQQFAFVDFKKNQKLYLQPVGKYYIVATLLTNAHTCLYVSATSTYFDIESPSLLEYFQQP